MDNIVNKVYIIIEVLKWIGESNTQLIGNGVWESTGNITWTMTYNNRPHTTSSNMTNVEKRTVSWSGRTAGW